ncbi:MAG: hypothetical protein H7Y11_13795, partial [Armatimonadetes bacterium]|nr:hypothetical protein [Anaerolineae bacterium]
MAILLGLVALFYLDYAALRSGYRQMSLSNTTPTEQVHITHQVSRLRVWRAMMLLVGWRVGAVLMLSNMIATTEFIARFAGKTSPTPSVLQSGILLVLGLGLALYYISEPIWRARLVTAFGMSAALEQRQRGTFAGSALGTSGARWVLGYGIVSFSLLLIGLLVAEAARYGLTSQQQIAIVWIGLIASFLVAGSVYYTLLPGQWLKRVAQGQSEGNPTPMPDALRDGFWDNVFPWMGTHRALPLSHPLMQGHVGAASAVGLGSIVRRWLPFYGALGFVGLGLVTAQANIPNTLRDFPFPINDGYDSVFSAVIKGSSVIVQAFFGIGILSVLGSLLLDLIVIAVGANVINQSRNSERGDLLRMTGQPESAMLYAEHTRVKQHARFGLRLVFGLRLLSAFAFGALAADIMYETLLSWVGQPSYVTLMVLGLWGFLVIYSLEPVWHYHAITSVGLAVAYLGRSIFNGWV